MKYIKQKYFDTWKQILNIDSKELNENLNQIIGTIHTFQGKQTHVVILLLCGNKSGAIFWAAEKPNILNVTIARIKKFLYVIGDIQRWRQQPHFSTLAELLPCVEGKLFIQDYFFVKEETIIE